MTDQQRVDLFNAALLELLNKYGFEASVRLKMTSDSGAIRYAPSIVDDFGITVPEASFTPVPNWQPPPDPAKP